MLKSQIKEEDIVYFLSLKLYNSLTDEQRKILYREARCLFSVIIVVDQSIGKCKQYIWKEDGNLEELIDDTKK